MDKKLERIFLKEFLKKKVKNEVTDISQSYLTFNLKKNLKFKNHILFLVWLT